MVWTGKHMGCGDGGGVPAPPPPLPSKKRSGGGLRNRKCKKNRHHGRHRSSHRPEAAKVVVDWLDAILDVESGVLGRVVEFLYTVETVRLASACCGLWREVYAVNRRVDICGHSGCSGAVVGLVPGAALRRLSHATSLRVHSMPVAAEDVRLSSSGHAFKASMLSNLSFLLGTMAHVQEVSIQDSAVMDMLGPLRAYLPRGITRLSLRGVGSEALDLEEDEDEEDSTARAPDALERLFAGRAWDTLRDLELAGPCFLERSLVRALKLLGEGQVLPRLRNLELSSCTSSPSPDKVTDAFGVSVTLGAAMAASQSLPEGAWLLESLHLGESDFLRQEGRLLLRELADGRCPDLHTIVLENCCMNEEALCDLAAALHGCPALAHLYLDITTVLGQSEGLLSLGRALGPGLQSLGLSCGSTLDPVVWETLFESCLVPMPHLSKLILRDDGLSARAVGALQRWIAASPHLRLLDLSHNTRMGDKALTRLSKSLSISCPLLTTVSLSPTSNACALAVSLALLPCADLQELDLSSCCTCVDAVGVQCLMELLHRANKPQVRLLVPRCLVPQLQLGEGPIAQLRILRHASLPAKGAGVLGLSTWAATDCSCQLPAWGGADAQQQFARIV
jgi:hypothetical protein